MRETQLCAQLVKTFRDLMPHAVTFNHSDRARSGQPDVSVNDVRTCWLELKLADPDFDSTGVQELTMKRLARHGFAYYVVYQCDAEEKNRMTTICDTSEFPTWRRSYRRRYDGFDHKAVVLFVRELVEK